MSAAVAIVSALCVLASVSVSISFNCNTFVCCLMANLRASYKSTFAASDLFLARQTHTHREIGKTRKNAANCFLFFLCCVVRVALIMQQSVAKWEKGSRGTFADLA